MKDNEYSPYGPEGCPFECDCDGRCTEGFREKVRQWAFNMNSPAAHMPELTEKERSTIVRGWFKEYDRRCNL